jgi:hypothetical protein
MITIVIGLYVYYPVLLPDFNPLGAELNLICHLLAFLGTYHIPHIRRIRVNENSILSPYFRKKILAYQIS